MCTAISFNSESHYFGRTLDLEYSYNENVIITPRNFKFKFRKTKNLNSHFAIIGIGISEEDFPLYYDAINEKGLCMAGLNFPQNAMYFPSKCDKENLAPFELIPFILGSFESVDQVKNALKTINIANIHFNKKFENTPLHWLVCDREKSIVIEQTKSGLDVFDNEIGVLTNSPNFTAQLQNLSNYSALSNTYKKPFFSREIDLSPYSNGLGAVGLPGDFSSMSRFVKATFVKLNSTCKDDENASISQFFHVLQSVEMPRGSVKIGRKFEKTVYTSCYNSREQILYYKTYENNQINAVDMKKENLNSKSLIIFKLNTEQNINFQN